MTTEKLLTQAIDPAHVRTVTGKGGELIRFEHFTVEPILGRHGEPPASVTAAFNQALRQTTPPLTPEDAAEQAAIRARGTNDPRVVAEGTIAYLITLDDGFRILYRDSGGRVTDYEKNAMTRIGRVDVLIGAVSASVSAGAHRAAGARVHAHCTGPMWYVPAHHDGSINELWRPTEPIFQAIKDDNPKIVTISKGYREPSCFDTTKRSSAVVGSRGVAEVRVTRYRITRSPLREALEGMVRVLYTPIGISADMLYDSGDVPSPRTTLEVRCPQPYPCRNPMNTRRAPAVHSSAD